MALAMLPQAHGAVKERPVVLLRRMPRFGNFLACEISSQLRQMVANFDEIIQPGDADFAASGLRQASLIRLSFLALRPVRTLSGHIGTISPERHRRLLARRCEHLRP